MLAAKKMDNLVVLIDYNKIQAVGRSDEIMGFTSLEEKFRSFGWGSCTVKGNDISSVIEALDKVPLKKGSPSDLYFPPRKAPALVLWKIKFSGITGFQARRI